MGKRNIKRRSIVVNSISALSKRAGEFGDWDELVPNDNYIKDNLGFTIPKDKFQGMIEPVAVTFGETQYGFPSIGIQCKTEDDISFWCNLYFSKNDSSNLITLRNLSIFGVDQEFLDENPDDNEAIELKILDSDPVNVRISHQEGDDGRTFLRPTFLPESEQLMDDDAFESVDGDDGDDW